jgi:hypothetical protein
MKVVPCRASSPA